MRLDGLAGEIGDRDPSSFGLAPLIVLEIFRILKRINEDAHFEQCIKAGIHAMYKVFPPIVAIEFARRVLPDEIRPSFEETEKIVKGAPAEAAA